MIGEDGVRVGLVRPRPAAEPDAPAAPPPPRTGSLPRPRLLLFDLDDTLCDYAAARDLRLRRAFAAALATAPSGGGADLDRLVAESIAIHPHGADHFPDLLRRHGVGDEAAAEAVAWYRANRFLGLALFADAVQTLAALRRALPGRPIGLVTNGPAEVQRAKIELLEVERLVDFAIVSGEFGAWKPDPAIFQEALRLGGAAPEEAVFVGDSAEHDITGARSVGIRAVWVNRTGRPWAHGEPGPDFEIPSLTALLPLLGVEES